MRIQVYAETPDGRRPILVESTLAIVDDVDAQPFIVADVLEGYVRDTINQVQLQARELHRANRPERSTSA